jgi:hypothetical protein
MSEVISTISLVVKGLTDAIKAIYPSWKVVYDENLDYQSSVEKLRKFNLINENYDNAFPMFSFKRSILHASTEVPRAVNVDVVDLGETTQDFANLFKSSYATFDVDFFIYSPNIDFIETIEVEYLSWQSLKSIRNFQVTIPGITLPMTYQSYFDDLDVFKINIKDKFYKSLGGKIHVKGWFLIIPDNPTYPKILEIKKTILNYHKEILESEDIVPN